MTKKSKGSGRLNGFPPANIVYPRRDECQFMRDVARNTTETPENFSLMVTTFTPGVSLIDEEALHETNSRLSVDIFF
jgi:hypothetical protein